MWRLFQRCVVDVPIVRLLIIVFGAWLIAAAVFAPWLYPLIFPGMHRDTESASMMGINWSEMSRARMEATDYLRSKGEWPADARALHRPDDNGLLAIDMPAPMILRFTMTRGFAPESGLRGSRLRMAWDAEKSLWDCQPDLPPVPERWLPSDCRSASAWTATQWLVTGLIAAVLGVLTMLILLGFADPRLSGLRQHPRRLRRQPIADLPRLNRQLSWLRRRDASLAAADIAIDDWREALNYVDADADARTHLLALRISARSTRSLGWSLPGDVHEWQLPPSLPVALDRLLVYTPAADLAARDVIRHVRGVQTGQDVMLVLSPQRATDAALMAYASDHSNLCVCVDQVTQCEWLLHPTPQDVLVAVLARQLRVTRISPYQTRGGITRPASFFGREQLLARVLNREPGNYLLVGGRQLGKTSLMKAIERSFADHPTVYCHYLSLRDHRLDARLAAELQCAADTAIEELVRLLAARAGQRRLLLLIDETDLFLREEMRTGYAQLSSLRSLSEEGHCHFMLAGFWDLYQATSLDYASPIRNFGEVISLGALEPSACMALATQPLARLGISYDDGVRVADAVAACGYRANLVAIVCQHVLEQLERDERVVAAKHLQRAMNSDAVLDALAGWARLSPDPRASMLDRVIVYHVAQRHGPPAAHAPPALPLSLAELSQAFADAAIDVDAEALRTAFSRLQLAYVLKRAGDGYVFAVPLFARQFHAEEVDALLRRELETLRDGSARHQAGGV